MSEKISKDQIRQMSPENLWHLYQDIRSVLVDSLRRQMKEIDGRLEALVNSPALEKPVAKLRPRKTTRSKVSPQFRNPTDPSQTWAGRGLRPRWLEAMIKNGKSIEDFRIAKGSAGRNSKRAA